MNKKIIIVLRPKSPVDGGWTEWSGWSTCDIDCLKSRVRECKNPAPFEGGSECPGNSTETDSCCGGDCWGKVNVKLSSDWDWDWGWDGDGVPPVPGDDSIISGATTT